MTAAPAPTAYRVFQPENRTTSVVFASPHSGRDYPQSFLKRTILNEKEVRSSEDAYVDQLFSAVPMSGAPMLTACAPRAFLDLNRGPDELDPALIEGVRRMPHNPRIASGLGVIPRVVANGRAIYRGKLSMSEAHGRLSDYWRPYHDQLQTLLDQNLRNFHEAILIDCHSMPHEALDHVAGSAATRPQIVLGDRFGAAAAGSVVEKVEAAFSRAGFRVARNMPFAGAYITQHYGRPTRRQHAVQVEIDRGLYMDEKTLQPHDGYTDFVSALSGAIADIAAIGRADRRLAAE